MKIKCGTDIIEISRIKDSIDNFGDKFVKSIYTENEINYCESHGPQRYQHYAGRFSAKEAAFKAISEELGSKFDLDWTDYEILDDENGKPHLLLPDNIMGKIKNIDVSLSHCKDYATANVSVLFK